MSDYCIGIDVGKTNTKVVCVDSHLKITTRFERQTHLTSNVDLLSLIEERVGATEDRVGRPASAVGVCLAGLVDARRQEFLFIPSMRSIPGFTSGTLASRLGRSRKTVFIDNDCACAALGEFRAGALRGRRDAALFSVGTGIGIGLLLGGRIHRGVRGIGGEIGHTPVFANRKRCECGQNGCYETLLPAHDILMSRPRSGADEKKVERFVGALGSLLGTITNLLNLERVVFLGHPFRNVDFRKRVIESITCCTSAEHGRDCDYCLGTLGRWAGAVGAASMALEKV